MTLLSGIDEFELKRLQGSLAQIEQVLSFGTASSEVVNALTTYVHHVKTRLSALEDKEKTLQDEKLLKADKELSIALAEREIALTQREREQYEHFLEKEYFTKADFGDLEEFYSNTWDRLSEGGKSEMSKRVWGGVRRGEYEFVELPEAVKEKEADRLQGLLRNGGGITKDLERIPAGDREDFLNAWDCGNRQESYTVLNRLGFAANVGTGAEREVVKTDAVTTGIDNKQEFLEAKPQPKKSPDAPKGGSDAMLSADILDGMQEPGAPLKAPLPERKGQGGKPLQP